MILRMTLRFLMRTTAWKEMLFMKIKISGRSTHFGWLMKTFLFYALSLRCLWDIQTEMSCRLLALWLWSSKKNSRWRPNFGSRSGVWKPFGDGRDPQEQGEPCAFLNEQAGELKSLSRCFDLIWKHAGEETRLTRWSGSLVLLLFSC